ncbi:MAG: hypothetical protein ABI212_06645 [Burkholderiaceae bacterium]
MEPLVCAIHIGQSLVMSSWVTRVAVGLYASLRDRGVVAAMASTSAFVVLVGANALMILTNCFPLTSWRSLLEGLSSAS